MVNNVLTIIGLSVVGIVAALSGGVSMSIVIGQVAAETGSILGILELLSTVVAPIIGALVAVVLWLHRRLKGVEESVDDMESSVFGNERDALNEGVLFEVRNINQRLDKIQESIDHLREENEKLRRAQRKADITIDDEDLFDKDSD